MNRPFQFHKRSQLFIGTLDETLSVAMRVYEVRPRKDHRGVDLIFRCAAVRSAVANGQRNPVVKRDVDRKWKFGLDLAI